MSDIYTFFFFFWSYTGGGNSSINVGCDRTLTQIVSDSFNIISRLKYILSIELGQTSNYVCSMKPLEV